MNEVLFIGTLLLSLSLILLAARLGREWLLGLVVIYLLVANLFASKLSLVFGFTTSLAIPLYAAIFLATDTLAEHFGKKEAFKAVWLGFLAQVCLAAFGFMLARATPLDMPATKAVSDALSTVFGFIPRIVAGSFIAYLVSQNFDVWFYHWLKRRTDGKHLWLRNCISTTISQGIDTCVFLLIAFLGAIPHLGAFILTTWLIKIAIALIDTPFIYVTGAIIKKTRQTEPAAGAGH